MFLNRVIDFSVTAGCLPWSKTWAQFELISKGDAPNGKAGICVKHNVNAKGCLTVELFSTNYTDK
jgi:hypothetical protein